MKELKVNNASSIFVLIFCLITSISVLFFLLIVQLKISFPALIMQIRESYYFPYTNLSKVGNIQNINLNIYLYGVILVTSLTAIFVESIRRDKNCFPSLKKSLSVFPKAGFLVLFMIVGVQTTNHFKVYKNEGDIFGGKNLQDKGTFIHKQPYTFAQYCRRDFPGRHRGGLITDRDISREPHMGQHRVLAYFLYPTIDIRGVNPALPVDSYVLFEKQNAAHFVPEGFEMRMKFNASSLLAVKK